MNLFTTKTDAGDYDIKQAATSLGLDPGEISDGFHTFNSLYYQRMALFAVIVNTYSHLAWKSWNHADGEKCFGGGWFVVGINTKYGQYTYHYEEKYWDMFNCKILPTAPEWDGHTDKDVYRLFSIVPKSKETNAGSGLFGTDADNVKIV